MKTTFIVASAMIVMGKAARVRGENDNETTTTYDIGTEHVEEKPFPTQDQSEVGAQNTEMYVDTPQEI